jgi:hypothetical protein
MNDQVKLLNSHKRLNNFQLASKVIDEGAREVLKINKNNFEKYIKAVNYEATSVEHGHTTTHQSIKAVIALMG